LSLDQPAAVELLQLHPVVFVELVEVLVVALGHQVGTVRAVAGPVVSRIAGAPPGCPGRRSRELDELELLRAVVLPTGGSMIRPNRSKP